MKRKYLIIIFILLLTSCKTKTYTVTFIDDNQELSKVEVKKGDNISDIEIPTKEGYLFLSWLKDGIDYDTDNPITEDITLEATWVEVPTLTKTHIITFNFGDEIKTMNVKEGDTIPNPKETPHKEKYKFIGWYLDDTLYDFNTPVDKDITLIAKFEKNRILINYDLDGGTGTIQVEIEKGTIPTKPKDPKKFGYKFKYWTINDKIYNFDKPLEDDITIKANYEPNVYVKVSFDTNGGNKIPSQMIISGESISNIPTPEKEGYTFKYWTYNNEKFDTNMIITTNMTLVALYEETSS